MADLATLKPGPFVTLTKVAPIGSLQARKGASGAVNFYWRYSFEGTSERVLIGAYGSAIPPKTLTPTPQGYTLAAAIRAAEALATEHHQHRAEGGRPALQARAKAQAEASAQAERQAAQAKQMEQKHTLESLCADYLDHLRRIGRGSHADAASIFKLHVIGAWPKVARQPARNVTAEQVADMMRMLVEAGKGRTANKLRSYLRAAYELAMAARTNPAVPLKLKGYQVENNPAAACAVITSANRADKRPLSESELRTYWQTIKDLPGLKGAALRLHLLTGGQRIEQLVRLKVEDVGADSITLYDTKGRPGTQPRPHEIPLVPSAKKALKDVLADPVFALSTVRGKHMTGITLSRWAADVVGEAIPDFQLKRVRSGVETALAAAGVSQEIRGRLQSHGLAGVQARHYDGHDYMPEKKRALEALVAILEREDADNVVNIRASA